ncbi:MAG: hypothetical protein PHX63_08275 [Eubacteriales bacterium]|nr:hypothetical protein [Eubacteriales bacterium]
MQLAVDIIQSGNGRNATYSFNSNSTQRRLCRNGDMQYHCLVKEVKHYGLYTKII